MSESTDLPNSFNGCTIFHNVMPHNLFTISLFMNFLGYIPLPLLFNQTFALPFLFQGNLGFHWDQFVGYWNYTGWAATR